MAGFIVISILIGLFTGIYLEFQYAYEFSPSMVDANNVTIVDALINLNLVQGVNQTYTAVFDILNPTNPLDMVGSLLSAGVGSMKTIIGIIGLVPEIILVLTNYYTNIIPPIVSQLLGLIFSVYVGFILLRYYTRTE